MILYLHIGTGKTGTTSIQTFLELNREALRKRGVVVPVSPGRRNHLRLTPYALNDGVIDNTRRARGLLRPDQVAHFRERFAQRFREEAATWTDGHTVIMSSEQMTRLSQPEEIARLRALLSFATKTFIVVYFRRQDEYFVSEYSQLIKGGRGIALDGALKHIKKQVYNYHAFLQNWADAFGKENIIVRPFERSQMVGGDAVQDFASVVGLDGLSEYVLPPRRNLSLDVHTVEYLRRLNPHIPRFVNDAPNPLRAGLIELLEEISDGQKLSLSQATAELFLQQFKESNAQVAREYLNRDDGVLFREGPASGEGEAPSLSKNEIFSITARIWAHLRNTPQLRDDASPDSALHERPVE